MSVKGEGMERSSQKNWDRGNMTTLNCRVTKTRAAEFKEACTKLGTNVNAVFLKAISKTIDQAKEKGDQ